MGFTSAFGIGFAALIVASANLLAADRPAPPAPAPAPESSDSVTVLVENLRGQRGVVRLCLTARSDQFPHCGHGSRGADVPVKAGGARHVFTGVRPGVYAIAAFHDANSDGKMDTVLGIPREGFAFSRNPELRPRAPRFGEASFASGDGAVQQLKMRYLL